MGWRSWVGEDVGRGLVVESRVGVMGHAVAGGREWAVVGCESLVCGRKLVVVSIMLGLQVRWLLVLIKLY